MRPTAVSERVGDRVTRARGREGGRERARARGRGKGRERERGRGRGRGRTGAREGGVGGERDRSQGDTARQRGLFSMSGHFVGLLGAEASSCVEDTQT